MTDSQFQVRNFYQDRTYAVGYGVRCEDFTPTLTLPLKGEGILRKFLTPAPAPTPLCRAGWAAIP